MLDYSTDKKQSSGNTGITVLLCSQILGFIAKGSYGPILEVKDIFKDKVFAVKVSNIQYNSIIYKYKTGFVQLFSSFIGFAKVRDCEARSGGAAER